MKFPWLLTLRPMVIPTDARGEMWMLAAGRTQTEYLDKAWGARVAAGKPVKRPRSRSWPKSCREARKGAYMLPQTASNVTPMKRKAKP
jgi:hypothetical protein